MSATKSQKIQALAVILENAQATLPQPSTASDGADITSWRNAAYSPDFATIAIDSDGVSTLTGPVELYGYDQTDAKWRKLGDLNSGNDIVLTATLGFEQRVRDVGVFERLAVACATISAGNITATAKPLEVIGTGG